MLDQFNDQLNKNIESKNLENLKQHKPFIINLDDLEFFWQMSNSEKVAEQFIDFVESWSTSKDKGPYHFNFSHFVSKNHKKDEVKNNSGDFFNWKKFSESLTS